MSMANDSYGQIPDKNDKKKQAEDVLFLLIDAVDELVPESMNAIIHAHKNRAYNPTWGRYVEELVRGRSPSIYIETSGISRMQYHNHEIYILYSGEIPSKIQGKTIQNVWDEVKNKYNTRISSLMDELGIK